ncbi:unnamed protein product [Cylicocyclus nassatus]|uniref:DUF7622 domain-containing protein n=1 Tax=Cylicocyclus nassatus TaxID=53992 RepID=A0AA36M7Y9_CYLNA|nr:unnamed protein product [Cylicocyclus nassatus]
MLILVRLALGSLVLCNSAFALIRCRKCEYDFETDTESCGEDCSGTLCFYSEYYYVQPERLFTRKGCISGTAPSMGCRSNQDGQVLCLCDTTYCNRDEHVLKSTQPTPLNLQVCKRELNNGLEKPSRWVNPCAGNFCVFKRTRYALENGTKIYAQAKDCTTSSDFDLFQSQLPFLFYPNTCAKLEYGGQPDETLCYGTMADDREAVFPAENLVECHADFLSRHLPYIPVMKLCRGQYCVISASPQGDVYRGCMTLDQTKNEAQNIVPGYYQSYNGVEQWVCATSSCNYDLQKMEESWPEEMAQYKNISKLRISGLFEELNTGSSSTTSWLCAVSLLIAGLLLLIY